MAKSNAKFVATVKKWAEVTEDHMLIVKRQVAKEMFRRVINRTPLWRDDDPNHPPGKTKGNWTASSGRPTTKELKRVDPSGQITIKAMEKVVDKILAGKSAFLSNTSEYIFVLEYGKYPVGGRGSWNDKTRDYEKRSTGGWSNQLLQFSAQGMVRISVSEFEEIVNKITRKYKVRIS